MNNKNKDINYISKKLIMYLRKEFNNPDIEYDSSFIKLEGGYETLSCLFKLTGVRGELSHFLVLRLYPSYYGTHNALWESTIQNVLACEGYPAAKVHFVCTEMSILGGAFFIMDYLPGQPLMFAPPETVPGLLGKTHAELHTIDPKPLIKAIKKLGVDEYRYSLKSRIDWLQTKAHLLPWIQEGINWLISHQPPEPEHLAVCHGDFHALNILVKDGEVTGVLDWPGFAIADPVFDVANTIVLTTIPAKYLTTSMEGFSTIDWDFAAELYLSAYRTYKELDSTYLDYYRVRRCLMALVQGFEGQQIWQDPMIVADLVGYIEKITDIQITVPV